jgi:chitinase
MKRTFRSIYMITLGLLVSPVYAATIAATPFSPYADMTINTHWDSKYQDLEPMDLVKAASSSGTKSFHLAFITDAGNCTPAWGSQASYAINQHWGSHLTDALRKNKINYIISFGGATGDDLSKACSQDQLAAVFENVIKVYQPQGLDFDIEDGTVNLTTLMNAIVQTQNKHANLKISFTLPTLPEGITDPGKQVLKEATKNHIQYNVNIMAMDYDPTYVNDMGEYAIQAATNLFNFLRFLYPDDADAVLWNKVEVTPMIGVNDVSVEEFTLKNVVTLKTFANQNQLGGLAFWSVARDNPCKDKSASATCSGDNLQTKPYEFSKEFLK